MSKHAYLIIAHNHFDQLGKLINMLDDCRNDIFLHIDKKIENFDLSKISSTLKYSKVYMVESPVKVTWGGYSQIESELLLLEKATVTDTYKYYHLLSGLDLPLKSQDYIHQFYDENTGKEFIRFAKSSNEYYERVKYYYFFNSIIGKPDKLWKKAIKLLEVFSVKIQKFFGIDRHLDVEFKKGTNWFSITDELARYVVSKRNWIKKTFSHTFCCDEVFLQTLVFNSKFMERLYWGKFDNDCQAIMRLIDWDRGLPYTFRENDYDQLKTTNLLFARKFDDTIDDKIIFKIQELVKNQE
ncbi:Core-2/I-Branching enzyme [Bacillus sp. OV166]|uniref:beta-1,6-N-acetylglucosaminyltransferase n=1 Tax=Bacillus sp. OV166 TaxID=1882763 RepID=UPI000A2AA881|nr:beta-1,6-N-acetylglucosaminyltransferase [Bacillus sp. OV166]SMQ85069.1 Core-2/I-Branching enzyme [Bacillus sp. OV166]